MINQTSNSTMPYILSNTCQVAYEKIKSLIKKIFALIKQKDTQISSPDFRDAYLDFAMRLKDEGHIDESYCYMEICNMYYHLLDNPDKLIAHELFFKDLFKAFDELLFVKFNNFKGYGDKYDDFIIYLGEMETYFYSEVATPTKNYDEDVCRKIINCLNGDDDE